MKIPGLLIVNACKCYSWTDANCSRIAMLLVVLLFACSAVVTLALPSAADIVDEEDYATSKDLIVASTSLGKVVGRREGLVNSFLGIPYAEPPTGRYRFRPSRPKRPWYPSMYKALGMSPECLQSALYAGEDSSRSEDCLYLNIWQPAKQPKGTLLAASGLAPVLFWVYGGGFQHGGSTRPEYFGDKLASKGVVVVSCNYRVGALGFLVSISDGLLGNYGLHDQKLALQWVNDNIQHFGGDPNKITLFGESAGAMSTGLHLLDQYGMTSGRNHRNKGVPRKKLFQNVIMQSNPLGYKYRSLHVANFIGEAYKEMLDCEDVRCMQAESADELIHVQDTLMAVPRSVGDFFNWGPVVTDASYYREVKLRSPTEPISNVTVRQPMETIKDLIKLDIPIIMGTNTHEGTVFIEAAFPTRMTKIVYQILVMSFFREAGLQVMRMYAPLTRRIDKTPKGDYRLVFSLILGDYLFRCPNQLFASKLAQIGTPVHLYEFALATRIPGFPGCDGLACHTAEIPYVFDHGAIIADQFSYVRPSLESSPNTNSKNSSDHSTGNGNNADDKSDNSNNNPLTSWLGSLVNNIKDATMPTSTTVPAKEQRRVVDNRVACIMSEYWTAFATYRDPNGLPVPNHNGGVAAGTRPLAGPGEGVAPWWPRVTGELPSERAMLDMQAQMLSSSSKQRKREGGENGTPTLATTANSDFYLKLAWDASYRQVASDDNSADDLLQFEDDYNNNNEVTTIDGVVSSDNSNNVIMPQVIQLPPQLQVSPNPAASHTYDPYGVDAASIFQVEGSQKWKFGGRSRQQMMLPDSFMHVMRFDEQSEVLVSDNDCICQAWNKLDYRF